MLAVQSSPHAATGGGKDIVHRRGRSRHVSITAIARQASEERRVSCAVAAMAVRTTERTHISESSSTLQYSIHTSTTTTMIPLAAPKPLVATSAPPFMRSASPSPPSSASMSPDYYDSPPSPPRSLEDQVHQAYALEDIHLAKILLLRLKGIEVTSDDDPRIAAVQDEDFDFCFLPNGPLLNEQDEKALKQIQAREMERIEELRRVERMRVCERKWVEEKQRLRDAKVAMLKRKERRRLEEEERQRRAEEEERRRALRATEMHRSALRRSRTRGDRKIVSYDHLASSAHGKAERDKQFVYEYMIPGPSSFPPRIPTTPSPTPVHKRHSFPTPTFDDSTTIPFKDVLQCMAGRLFPVTNEERLQRSATPATSKSRSRTQSQPKQKRRELQLIEALLVEVNYAEEERRKRKGKDRAQSRRSPACLACSASRSPDPSPSSTMSSSSSSVSRTSSWLSFRTSSPSTSSTSTDITTPSTSPVTSPKSSWFAASRPRSWIPGSTFTDSPQAMTMPSLRHSCEAHNKLTAIALADGPLEVDVSPPSTTKSSPISYEGRQRSSSRARAATEGAGVLVRRMSKLVELAKGFQNAYVNAALFSVTASYDSFDNHCDFEKEGRALPRASGAANLASLQPAGSRASVTDVKTFLKFAPVLTRPSQEMADGAHEHSHPPKYIPLTSPYPPTEPQQTVLSKPLPYQLHFKPIPQPVRSPFRHHVYSEVQKMHSSSMSECYPDASQVPAGPFAWRIRLVGNPVHLRLKALQNVTCRQGIQWEGSAKETAMGGGRERVIGVAYEGVGRSALSYSTRTTSR